MARFTLRPTKKAADGADGAPGGSIPYGFVITAAWAWRLIVIGVVALALLKLFATLSSILMPLIIALIIAAPLEHLVTRMEKHRIPRGAGAAIVMLTLTLLVLGLLGAAGGTIAAGFDDLRQEAVEGFNTFLEWLTTGPFHVDPAQIDEWAAKAQDFLTKNWLGVANGALSVTSTIGSVLAGTVIALLGLFFFLKDGRVMWLWGVKHVGGSNAERIDNAGVAAWGTLGGYARTSATVALIDATGIAIGAWILGLPLVIPIAILVFLFSFVPMFGAAISGAIAVLVALVDGGWTRALIMLGVVVLVQQVEGTVLYPLLFGKTASVHPMVILLSVSAGTLLAGFLGAVIAVPFVSFVTTLVTKLRDPDARELEEAADDGAEPAPCLMECAYFEAGRCRSCTLIELPHVVQVARKVEHCTSLLPTGIAWHAPVVGPERGFRTKAKMVVGGSVSSPTLGILSPDGTGVDLAECPLYPPQLAMAFAPLTAFVTRAAIEPYSVPERRGELKNVIVTVAPSGELMVRFVLRSTESLARIRKHLPWLEAQLPQLAVASVNLLSEHRAVVEGEREIVLTEGESLAMTVNGIDLHLKPQSFFQTNTDVATALYRQAAAWVDAASPKSVWDLYCGVGGFALHLTVPGRRVTGVEVSDAAVQSAQRSALALGADATFIASDATAWALAQPGPPDLVVVNPPRRGIGEALADWLEASGVRTVVYSSCNSESLAKDLARMPSLRPVEGRVLDMFPHTEHYEVAVLLERA